MSVQTYRAPGGELLSYREDDSTAPFSDCATVVLAHGFSKNSRFWYEWVPPLSSRYRVIRPDLRGLGLSKVPANGYQLSLRSLTLDAISLIEHLGLERVIWIGEATGALTGLSLALSQPDRVARLVMTSAPIGLVRNAPIFQYRRDGDHDDALSGDASTELMTTHGMREWAKRAAPYLPWTNECPPEYLAWYLDEMGREDPLLCAAFRTGMLSVDVSAEIDEVRVPALYLDGERDSHLRPEEQERLRQHPSFDYVQLEGPGIDLCYARPAESIAAVVDWLESRG